MFEHEAAESGDTVTVLPETTELDVPVLGGVSLPQVDTGTKIPDDRERGVVYRDHLTTQER